MQQTNRVRITIRKAFAHRAGAPVQLIGVILSETPRAIRVNGHAVCEDAVCCARCGRDLSDPVSRLIGVGPECCEHWHIARPSSEKSFTQADVEALRAKVRAVTYTGWIPKSCATVADATEQEDVETMTAPQVPSADALADYLADLDYELTLLAAEAAGHRPSQTAAPVAPEATHVVIDLTERYIVIAGLPNTPELRTLAAAFDGFLLASGLYYFARTARAAYELLQRYPRAETPVEVYKAAAAWKQRLAAVQAQPVVAAALP